MRRVTLLMSMFSLVVLLSLATGCARSTSAPVTEAPTAKPTPEPPTSTPIPPTAQPSDEGTVEKSQMTSQALAGNLLGDPATRECYIYLPPGYEATDTRYPVV
jgi:hypothetical protein